MTEPENRTVTKEK
jgi:hypothetical protein